MEKTKKIGFMEKIIYGSGDVGLCAMFTVFSSYVLFFYTDVLGLQAAAVGVAILLCKIMDGISDLIAGQWIDTHKSAKGHCIPVLIRWTIPMIVSVVLVFTVPNSSFIVRMVYIFITYNLFNTVTYTVVCAAHNTLASYVTNDSKICSQLMVYKMMFAALSQTILASVTLPVVEFFGGQNNQIAWVKALVFFGISGGIFLLLNILFVKERVDNPTPGENIIKSIKVAFQNKYWIMSLINSVSVNVMLILNLSVSVYYMNHVMHNIGLVGAWVAVCNLPGIFVALAIPTLLDKGITRRQMVIFGAVLMLIGAVIFALAPESVPIMIATGLVRGIGLGFPIGMQNALIANTIDYGEWKTGTRVQGVLLGAAGVGVKVGQGAITSIFGIFLTAVGYDGLLEVQPDSAISGISLFFKLVPIIVTVIILINGYFYKVEDLSEQIQKDLVERRGELS